MHAFGGVELEVDFVAGFELHAFFVSDAEACCGEIGDDPLRTVHGFGDEPWVRAEVALVF